MKKTAAVLLAMIMMLFAACALAAPEVTAGNGGIYTYAANLLTLKAAGEYTVSGWNDGDGVPTAGRIVIQDGVSGSVTLNLEDVHLDAPEDYALEWINNQQGVNCTLTVEFANSSLEGKGGMRVINRLGSASMTVAGANAMITGNEYCAVSVLSGPGSAVVTVSGENASFSGTTDGISSQGQKVTMNVTGANAMISAEGFGISARSQGDTEVSVTGAGAVVEGNYGIYVHSYGGAAVNVEGIKRITAESRGVYVNEKVKKLSEPLKFRSSDGFDILVGRNNRQNDQLTLKTAKATDIWLHTQGLAGSHVIIRTEGRDVPEQTLFEAAMLAAYHSKGRESSQVPVDYTAVKFVKKPAGAKPGMVIVTNNRTLFVAPDEELCERLKVK